MQYDDNESGSSSMFKIGVGGGALLIGSALNNESTKAMYSKTLGASYLDSQMKRASAILTGTSPSDLRTSLLSQLMAVEEASPLHILRTLQLSNLLQPFTNLESNGQQVHITAAQVRDQEFFYRKMLEFNTKNQEDKVKRLLRTEDLVRGMFYKNGSLFGAGKDGKINESDVILKRASLVLGNVKNGDIVSENQLLNKYANIINGGLNKQALKRDPLMVIGANSDIKLASQWGQSYLRYSMEVGFKTLDNPIAGLEELLSGMGAHKTGLLQSSGWQTLRKYGNIKLGTGGVYNLGVRDSLKITAKNLAVKGTLAYGGYQVADSLVRSISPDDGLFSNGLAAGLANVYAASRISFAKVWSDRFQGYKKQQEQNAPGSTNLLSLAAFPMSGALAGAQVAYFNRMRTTLTQGTEKAASIYNVEKTSPLLSKLGIKSELKPMKRNAVIGAVIGAALTLPFLPGALIGSSSKELEDLYSGRKETEIRANRWWLAGGNSYEGSHVKYFEKSFVARLNAQAKDKVRYGDDATKKKLSPILHPFSYLRDPYKFEKMHQKDMPYPVWGMDVSYGSFMGKVFERTLGQIIKPDTLNPKVLAAKKIYEEFQKTSLEMTSIGGFDIDSDINSFKKQNREKSAGNLPSPEEGSSNKHPYGISPNDISPNNKNIEGIKDSGKNQASINLSNYDVSVEDGDTVVLTDKNNSKNVSKVRLSGLDTPEIKHDINSSDGKDRYAQEQLYGEQSKAKLEELIKKQGNLSLIINKGDMSYGRYVGVLAGDNDSNLNLEMLKQGAAMALPWDSTDLMKKSTVLAAEREAQKEGNGLWAYNKYQAVALFNKATGQRQTFNTLTNLAALSQRPELGAYATYLGGLEDTKGPLSESQMEDVVKLANIYTEKGQEYKDANARLREVDISLERPTSESAAITGANNLKFNNLTAKAEDKLVSSGLMTSVKDVNYNPDKEGFTLAYRAFSDFTGLKGWTSSLLAGKLNLEPEVGKQLSKSGEANNIARDIIDANLGDMAGIGEFQRRLVGTSSAAVPNRDNPLKNDQASWLPKSIDNYYIDFSTGNSFSKVERGEERLPGVGYEALNPEVKGLKPEEYPLIYQYKILADVAKGSREHINARRQVLNAYKEGKLGEREIEILGDTLDQEEARDNRKTFSDFGNDAAQISKGPIQGLQSSLWKTMVNVASKNPLESLTPFRPAAKFLHKRTAIEDYVATQLGGPDTGIWTNPYSHFIKPTLNKLRQTGTLGDKFFIPEETKEKYEIDEYFDKFNYLKQRRNGDITAALRTVVSSSMSGLNTKDKVLKFKASLSDDQRDYFEAFSKETSIGKREAIRKILPKDVLRGYEQIWRNLDTANAARKKGTSIQRALAEDIHEQSGALASSFKIKLSSKEIEGIRATVDGNRDSYAGMGFSTEDRIKYAKDEAIRSKVADAEASRFVSSKTKIPNNLFAGWDPRLLVDDIKIRTLAVGREDLRRFGFWKADEERMNRMPALADDKQVVNKIKEIRKQLNENRAIKNQIDSIMFRNGFKTNNIDLHESATNNIVVKERS